MNKKFFSYSATKTPELKMRPARSNKGTFGNVLIIGGSRGMSGAPYFSAKAAYLMGTGLVRIYSPEYNRNILQTILPEALVVPYDEASPDISALSYAMKKSNAIAIGMGLGKSKSAKQILEFVLSNANCPLLLDADALNIISENKSLWNYINPERKTVITPHVGEMSRLTNICTEKILEDISFYADEFAQKHKIICLLKDEKTIVSNGYTPSPTYQNQSGNNGMATAGAGDVLDGIIISLIAQGYEEFFATCVGAYIHGVAGDIASSELSEFSVTASDIMNSIPQAIKKHIKITS